MARFEPDGKVKEDQRFFCEEYSRTIPFASAALSGRLGAGELPEVAF
jgi:hypothetical protein